MRTTLLIFAAVFVAAGHAALAAPPAKDPVAAEMQAVLDRVHKVYPGLGQKAVDDAVEELHRAIAKFDPKVFVPNSVGELMRLAPRDTQTRVLLRQALAQGWLEEFLARKLLVQAGDGPESHVKAVLKAFDSPNADTRRAALYAAEGFGSAGAELLPRLQKLVADAKADPSDFRRPIGANEQIPEHILAYGAIKAIEKSKTEAKSRKPEQP